MLIIGLMVIALVCLAVGLALPSSAWLIASLIATAGAGYLVWKMRSAIAPATAGTSAATSAATGEPLGIDGRDDGSGAGDTSARDADSDRDADAETTTIARLASDADVDTRVQHPGDDSTQVIAAAPADAAGGDVWVIDGRPRYHLGSCPIIQGQDAEPIPLDQAVEDGFMPCSLCEPTLAPTPH